VVLGCKALICAMPLNTSLAGSPCQLQALCTMLWWGHLWSHNCHQCDIIVH
jgi:hypothetical protein